MEPESNPGHISESHVHYNCATSTPIGCETAAGKHARICVVSIVSEFKGIKQPKVLIEAIAHNDSFNLERLE